MDKRTNLKTWSVVLVFLLSFMTSINASAGAAETTIEFEIEQVTDNSYHDYWPAISFSDLGQGLMVWSLYYSQDNHDMYYALWDGSSWSSSSAFRTTGWRHQLISIDYKPGTNEAMLVVGGSTNHDDLWYEQWDGSSWGSEYHLADGIDDDDCEGAFKWSPDGSYGLNIWEDHVHWTTQKRGIAYTKWDGSSWSTSTTITADDPPNYTRRGGHGCLDFDPSTGKAIVTYYRSDGNDYEIYYQAWDGSSWGGEVQLTDNSSDDMLPWIKFDNDGNSIIIWEGFDGNDWEIYYSLWDGSVFTGEYAMTCNSYDDNNPTAIYDSQGSLHIFWYGEFLGADTEILYTTFDGIAFSEPIQITDNNKSDIYQVPSIDNDGNIHFVWIQHDGNDYEVMRGEVAYVYVGDFEPDGDVDLADFAVLAAAWLSSPGDDNWNPACDISIPADNFIDMLDLTVFSGNWLAGIE